jgi:hypothetical protein
MLESNDKTEARRATPGAQIFSQRAISNAMQGDGTNAAV